VVCQGATRALRGAGKRRCLLRRLRPELRRPGSSFECNICLETPNDPVVTLCGHLFCWACLYRWLRGHAHTNECPVCKAGVEEDKVVPLYGRGKASCDPRQRPVPGAEVPNRPTGRRPEATRHARADSGFGFFPSVGVGGPFASAQIGGFTVSAGFGLFPALFGGWNFAAAPGVGLHHPGAPPRIRTWRPCGSRGCSGTWQPRNRTLSFPDSSSPSASASCWPSPSPDRAHSPADTSFAFSQQKGSCQPAWTSPCTASEGLGKARLSAPAEESVCRLSLAKTGWSRLSWTGIEEAPSS